MTTTDKKQVAGALLSAQAVGFSPQSPVRFASGILSPVYVDNRVLSFHPQQWHIVIQAFQNLIQAQNIIADVIAGVAVGGVPHSAALAFTLNIPHVFIRKEAKGYGKQRRVEGGDITAKNVLLVEDLVTTGGSSLSAVNALRDEGGAVSDVLAIVSYGFSQARETFATAQVKLHTLTDFQTILDEAFALSYFDKEQLDIIRDWFAEPQAWGKRHGYE